jgi:hypothetical protein
MCYIFKVRRTQVYIIRFYRTNREVSPVRDFLKDLGKKTDKDSRIRFTKTRDYINALELGGLSIGEPYDRDPIK